MDLTINQRRLGHQAGMSVSAMSNMLEAMASGEVPTGGAVLSDADAGRPALLTVNDGDVACGSALSRTPIGAVRVEVNGLTALLGVDCYFSGGKPAAGSVLHWNGSAAGFQLAPSDVVSFYYEV